MKGQRRCGGLRSAASVLALLVAMGLGWGCNTALDAPLTDGSTGEDVGDSGDGSSGQDVTDSGGDDTDTGTDEPVANDCGGSGALTHEGVAAELLSSCGCGGSLVCNGLESLRCAGESSLNACGGCGALAVEIGSSCGACGGTWVCGADGDAVCVGAARANGCGGCASLPGAPGSACENEAEDEATWVCVGPDELACRALVGEENACGGQGALEHAGAAALPGESCEDAERLCGSGVLVCAEGRDRVTCEGTPRNAAGGCGPLLGVPGASCGCGGEWVLDSAATGGVRCEGGAPNACGGCAALADEPGVVCGSDNVFVCVGADDTVCVDRSGDRNLCGGSSSLSGAPGAVCGACDTGRWVCDGPNRVTCGGDRQAAAFNPCDGSCAPLAGGVEGGACGVCSAGALACGEGAALVCEDAGEEARNACGGCAPLAGEPEASCGRCAQWRCREDEESVRCVVDASLPGCADVRLRCADLEPPCVQRNRSCLEGADTVDAVCGGCLDGFEEVEGACVQDTPTVRTCAQAGCAGQGRECIQPDAQTDATCGECLAGYEEVAGECEPPAGVPRGVTASQGTSPDHVEVSWDAVAGASGYHVYRNGTRVTTTPVVGTSYNDDGAPEGGVPNQVVGLMASTNRTSDVFVSWSEATAPNGATAVYAVRAVQGSEESALSAEATGFRAAYPVTGYQVQVNGGSWSTVGAMPGWVDTSAPTGTVSVERPTATTTLPDRVDLSVAEPSVTTGASRSYRVRAVNATGTGAQSAAASGQRSVGSPIYQWQWSTSEGGNYVNLSGGSLRTATDEAIAPDSTRWYRVRVSVSGAPETISEVVEGRRASGSNVPGEECSSDSECAGGLWCPTDTDERRCSPRPELDGVQMPFQWVPRGTFQMGSPVGEVGRINVREDQVSVTLTRDYFVQRTEVTQAQWAAVMGAWNALPSAQRRMSGWVSATPTFGVNPSYAGTTGLGWCTDGACPVESVNWWDAVVFANALSILEGLEPCYTLTECGTGTGVAGVGGGCSGTISGCGSGTFQCGGVTFEGKSCTGYRLPTEAEWERAARGGTTTATYRGNLSGTVDTCINPPAQPNLDPLAWWCGTSEQAGSTGRVQLVGSKTPNAWGLHDMLGNVWEWTWTRFSNPITGGPDPLGPPTGSNRILRGGSWERPAQTARSAYRESSAPNYRHRGDGIRLVRTAP